LRRLRLLQLLRRLHRLLQGLPSTYARLGKMVRDTFSYGA
jgi:hypothetical protein